MFLFGGCMEACQAVTPITGAGYQLHRNQACQFVNTLKDVDTNQLKKDLYKVIKMNKSDYQNTQNQLKKNKAKYTDDNFPPNSVSLGKIEAVPSDCKWKRIPQIIQNPELFGQRLQPSHVVQGSLRNCYFLSALAAIAEKPARIKKMFGQQKYNKEGIYKIPVRLNGEVQQVMVDDYVPVNQKGQPLFCQPNRNQFWVLILEKVWAKIHRSYANIIMGNPADVFRAFTFAPSQMKIMKDTVEFKQKLWNSLVDYTSNQYPICCNTGQDILKSSNLSPGHAYTLLGTGIVEDSQGVHHRMVKLRDPWGRYMWQGFANQKDNSFWNRIVTDSKRKDFFVKPQTGVYGVFCMTFNDFCQYFVQIHICMLNSETNYVFEPLIVNHLNNGSLYQVEIYHPGVYRFELHQSPFLELSEQQNKEEGICRSTLILAKVLNGGEYEFVDGVLKYNEQDTILHLQQPLAPGQYILFAKLNPTRIRQLVPLHSSVSIYSQHYAQLRQPENIINKQRFFSQMFLRHGRQNKRSEYNNGLMWVSWKLFFQQGGYAYVAIGNQHNSNKKFVVRFQQDDFEKEHFRLQGQYGGKGSQCIQVLPGQQRIIVASVKNQMTKSIKFPPSLGIKMQMMPQS